jgi:aryl-alcohol dehydrogenase-like predicted oxidoreductase
VRTRQAGGRTAAVSYDQKNFSPSYLRKALEGSLHRLRTDFVDLYQLHGPQAVHDDVVALMCDLRSEGKIRGFGVGLEGLQHATAWLETGSLSAIQVPFGPLDPQAGDQIIPRAAGLGLRVIVRAIFAGGFLARPLKSDLGRLRAGQPARLTALCDLASSAGVSPMQLALWYVVARPEVATVLVGTSSAAHLDEVAGYFQTVPDESLLLAVGKLLADTGAADL